MRKVRSASTGPETLLRQNLWAIGRRYRISGQNLPGRPDIVFPRQKLAVFVDGDYWHGNQWRIRGHKEIGDQFKFSERRAYWIDKIQRNMRRDRLVANLLISSGWSVLRLWESSLNKDMPRCLKMVTDMLDGNAEYSSLTPITTKTCAEFFAGIGLMRMGLERQGWTVAYANDIDEQKYAMYSQEFPDAKDHFHIGDVHGIDPSSVPTVSLATASFPCNDLSLAGSRSGLDGVNSSAFWGFMKVLEGMEERRPPLVLLENVPGFLTSHNGADITNALKALNGLGYRVDAFMVDAVRFVPQSRLRMFIVGHRTDRYGKKISDRENRIFYQSDVRPSALAQFILSRPDIDWEIRELPDLPQSSLTLESVLEDIPHTSKDWWSPERSSYLLNQMSDKHRQVADEMIAGSEWSYGTVFRRVRNQRSMAELRTDGIAGCLRTPRGGSGRQILVKAGKGQFNVRLLSGRECARLMGANDYRFEVPLNQALFGFGDAVCVPVIEWISKYYLEPLLNEILRDRPLMTLQRG